MCIFVEEHAVDEETLRCLEGCDYSQQAWTIPVRGFETTKDIGIVEEAYPFHDTE